MKKINNYVFLFLVSIISFSVFSCFGKTIELSPEEEVADYMYPGDLKKIKKLINTK